MDKDKEKAKAIVEQLELTLNKGKIQEMGSHDDLLQLGGFYAKLNEMQFKDKKSIN